jgi:hypothetical protein
MHTGSELSWPRGAGRPGRADLEAMLLPLVRRALRTRTGLPALVGWVHRNLPSPAGAAPDADRAAPGLARQLCEVLLRKEAARDRPCPDTVCGP